MSFGACRIRESYGSGHGDRRGRGENDRAGPDGSGIVLSSGPFGQVGNYMRVYIRMLRFITHFYIKCILNCGVKTVPKNILDFRAGERKPGSRKKFTKVRLCDE